MRKLPSLARKKPFRASKVRFILFMEGKNTEPQYFESFRKTIDGALVKLEYFPAAGCPITIANQAIAKLKAISKESRKDSFYENDSIWAIFDRDEHPKVKDAIRLCNDKKIGLAYSNPCFELWLLLHIDEYGKVCSHTQVQKDLASKIKGYDRSKGKVLDFDSLIENLGDAEKRARRQHDERIADSNDDSPPYTTVYKLTTAIAEAAEQYKG